jgi:hypothetical protein
MAYLAAHGEVLSRQFHDDRVVIHCRIAPEHLGPIEHEPGLMIRPHVRALGEHVDEADGSADESGGQTDAVA